MSPGCAADQRMSARQAAGESAIVDHSRLRDCRICATESLLVSLSTTRFRGLRPAGPPARPPDAQDLWISGSRSGLRAPARPPVRPVSGFDAGRRRALQLGAQARSEEHTSELQSLMRLSYAVFCLNKKKKS